MPLRGEEDEPEAPSHGRVCVANYKLHTAEIMPARRPCWQARQGRGRCRRSFQPAAGTTVVCCVGDWRRVGQRTMVVQHSTVHM